MPHLAAVSRRGQAPIRPGVFLVLLGLVGAGWPVRLTASCQSWLSALVPLHQATRTRAFDQADYQAEHERWGTTLSDPAAARGAIDGALAAGTLNGPEALFALLDSLSPKPGATYREQVAAIERSGTELKWRNFRFPYGWALPGTVAEGRGTPRRPSRTESRTWPAPSRTFPFVYRGRRLRFYFPDVAPRTPSELVQLAFYYSSALANYRLLDANRSSPVLSLPAGPAPWSFPRAALGILLESENHLYAQLTALRSLYPEVEIPLPEHDKVWRWRYPQLGIELLTRIWYPSYRPFDKYVPNRVDYEKYGLDRAAGLDGASPALRAGFERRYRDRLEMKWVVDRWRNLFTGMVLLGLGNSAWSLYQALTHGALTQLQKKWDDLFRRYSRENINRSLNEYHRDPQGFDVVNDFYNSRIQALQEKIARDGDPDGERQKQIHELEERRDYLKN